MTKHLLNGVEIRSVFKKVGSKGMAQRMWRDIFFNPSGLLIVFDDFPETLTAHTFTVHIHK